MNTKRTSTIWSHTIVYNEENFIWFALMSVVEYVDKMLIWDTGSTDNTVKIIEEVARRKQGKISFKQVGPVDRFQFTKVRQAMLDQTRADWFLVVDGDEVWWQESISKVTKTIKREADRLDAIVVPFYNAVGDIYHHQPESAGQYQLLRKKGHLTIRAINRSIPGLHLENPYGSEGYFDNTGQPIQERTHSRLLFLDTPFLHLTHLKRSRSLTGQVKYKHELGKAFEPDFAYPEVLYHPKPQIVPDPWRKRKVSFVIKSLIKGPPRYILRKFK